MALTCVALFIIIPTLFFFRIFYSLNRKSETIEKPTLRNCLFPGKMVTRSKTGSLTPKLFSDSVMGTTNIKTSGLKSTSSTTDEVLVINKDGEITKITRSKTSASSSVFQQQQYFKLGKKGHDKKLLVLDLKTLCEKKENSIYQLSFVHNVFFF